MGMTPEKKKKFTMWLIGIAAICVILFFGIQNIGALVGALSWCLELLMPLLVGVAIAIILNVPMRFLESHLWEKTKKPVLQKLRRPVSFVLSLIFIIAILAGVLWLVIPELVEAIKVIVEGAIDLVSELNAKSDEELAELPFGSILASVDWNKLLDSMLSWLKNQSGNIVNGVFGTITALIGGIFDFFVSFVFAVYILFSKDKLKSQSCRLVRTWLPEKVSEWIIHTASVLNVNFRNFVAGQSLEAVILGVLCIVGMLIFKFPYAPMVGVLVAVTALIPIVGGFIGGGIGAFMILTVDPMKAIWFLVFFIILQQLEGNLIYPRTIGSRVSLPGMWILAAVTVGGGIGGPVGMLLSVPIASTAYVLLREATEKREAKSKEQPKTESVLKDE